MRKLILLALGVAVTAVAITVVAQTAAKPRTPEPAQPQQQQERSKYEPRVTPEILRHSHLTEALYWIGTAYGFAILLFVLFTRISTRLRTIAARAARWNFIVAMVYFALLTLVTTALEFPLDFYRGFVVPHQFDLTTQSFGSWLGDFGKELGVNIVIGAFLVGLLYTAIRLIRRWWIVAWLGSIPLVVLGVIITPLIIDPLFNKFEPLKDAVLRRELLDEASRAGIENGRVYEVNKSKQTKTMNAYVTGVGPSARIVMWDTLLAKMDRDEVLAVMAHEMGHYVMKHIWKGMAFGIAVTFVGFWLGQTLYEAGLRRWGRRWNVDDPKDVAALPWLLTVSLAIGFVLSPVTSGFSRHVEHQADVFGLELTHLNGPMASAFVKFAEDSKQDPRPPRFVEWWHYSHPSLGRRIDFVLNYKPWEKGEPNQLWQPR